MGLGDNDVNDIDRHINHIGMICLLHRSILRAFRHSTESEYPKRNRQVEPTKKGSAIAKPSKLGAGAGFEPATFRLWVWYEYCAGSALQYDNLLYYMGL